MKMNLILGGPGSGKTTRLLNLMEQELSRGIKPERIGFVSFTKQAAEEAKTRAIARFGFCSDDLPYVRTLHSLCFSKTGTRPGMMLSMKDYRKIANTLGIELVSSMINPDDSVTAKEGDFMIHYHNLTRMTGLDLKKIWEGHGRRVSWGKLQQWVATCQDYKQRFNKKDFTDLLTEYVQEGTPVPCDVVFVDEAQDLTPLQWKVVNLAFAKVQKLFIAGDDDQAIYGWAGADVRKFLTLDYNQKEVLPVSYRLPFKVFSFAKIFAEKFIDDRYHKDWNAYEDNEPGFVRFITSVSQIDLRQGSWFMLARNSCFLKDFALEAFQKNMPYTYRKKMSLEETEIEAIELYDAWLNGKSLSMVDVKKVFKKINLNRRVPSGYHKITDFSTNPPEWFNALRAIPLSKRIYYKSIRANQGDLTNVKSQIAMDTIHAVKGGEADFVIIKTDMTRRSFESMLTNEKNEESRVFYVGATRAKKGLYILSPETGMNFSGYDQLKTRRN